MQAAKDTFLKTLAGRLAVLNPARTVTLDGVTRPAVMALENETPMRTGAVLECFLLDWQDAKQVVAGEPLMQMECKVNYATQGTDDLLRTDRGRILTAMDSELRQMCEPNKAAKCDYTQTPAAALGTSIFWSGPEMGEVRTADGALQRAAAIAVYFFPEVA